VEYRIHRTLIQVAKQQSQGKQKGYKKLNAQKYKKKKKKGKIKKIT